MWSLYEDKFHVSIIRSPDKSAGGDDLHSTITDMLIKIKLLTACNNPDHSYSIQEIIPCSTGIFLLFP